MIPRALQIPVVLQEAFKVVGQTQDEFSLPEGPSVRPEAGAQLMNHTADMFEDICNRNKLNEKKMFDCDMTIVQLYANLEAKNENFLRLNESISSLPDIEAQLNKSRKLLASVEAQLHETELAMIIMEDTKKMVEAKRRQLEESRERDLRMKLERQKIFEEQFRSDLELFKRSGSIAPVVAKKITPNEDLAEISLDQNDDDIEALKDFLESSGEFSDDSSNLTQLQGAR